MQGVDGSVHMDLRMYGGAGEAQSGHDRGLMRSAAGAGELQVGIRGCGGGGRRIGGGAVAMATGFEGIDRRWCGFGTRGVRVLLVASLTACMHAAPMQVVTYVRTYVPAECPV